MFGDPTDEYGRNCRGTVKFLTDMGLFIGQSPEFFQTMHKLAAAADAARRE